MIDNEALRLAESYIKSQLGNLDDLPRELSNTIANVYYQFACSLIDAYEMKKREYPIPKSMLNEMKKGDDVGDPRELFKKYLEKEAKIGTDVTAAYDFIQLLRKIDKTEQPNLYEATLVFIIDCLKYDIKDVGYKNEIQRAIERKLITVDEVPSLIDLMCFDSNN